ncbi:MAG: hypothetical protein AAGF30_08760 [Pseudomonadota bacterium]
MPFTKTLRRMGFYPILALATPALADIPTACTETPGFDDAIAQLEADGWQVQDRDAQLTETQVDAVAWTLMVTRYVGGGDTGGQDTETLLDLQRQAAPGLLLRFDTDTTRARVLLDGDDALTVTQTRTIPGRVERACRLASTAEPAAGIEPLDATGFDGAPTTLAEWITVLPEAE